MKSPITGKEMELIVRPATLTIRKEDYPVVHRVWKCVHSGEEFEVDVDEALEQAENQYRSRHNLPFPEQIREIREKYKVSALKMSEILRFGINQYGKYENGELPSESNANLIFLSQNPKDFIRLVELSAIDDHEKRELIDRAAQLLRNAEAEKTKVLCHLLMGDPKPVVERGFKQPDLNKLGGIVQFFSYSLQPYKTQLNKLLFYSDFYHFKRTGRSISGSLYRAIEMGPVPNNFDGIFQYFENEGYIRLHHTEYPNGSIGTKFFSDKNTLFEEMLNAAEQETIKTVYEKFQNFNTQKIIQLSHEEEAWKKNFSSHSLISYLDSYFLKAI